jgi:hypothetical protein
VQEKHDYGQPFQEGEHPIILLGGGSSDLSLPDGAIWCWRHDRREGIPESWRVRERLLRQGVIEEWTRVRREHGLLAFQSPLLTGWVTSYCQHRGWRLVDVKDRYDMFRFIGYLTEKQD